MKNRSRIEIQLGEILVKGNFTQLEPYKSSTSWESMTHQERELLGLVFVAEGKERLASGNNDAMRSFEYASQVASTNPKVFFAQAEAYGTQGKNPRCLLAACEALRVAVALDPEFFKAWAAWGTVLVNLGHFHQETVYCQDAHEKYLTAERLIANATPSDKAHLYWRWGNCWSLLGQLSGEPCDFQAAIEKFRHAEELGLQDPGFWHDYGNVIAECGMLMGKWEMFYEAHKFFCHVVDLAPDHFQGWLSLACCYQRLYAHFRDEMYLPIANEAFVRAEELDNRNLDLWLNWGRLLIVAAKAKDDSEQLRASIEKFAKANEIEPNHPIVLSGWGEALMLYGAVTERIDYLKSAEEKLIQSLELQPDNASTWGVYGTCLTELGCYFMEESYYFQAIEKFRYGLSLDSKHPMLWYGLSLANFAIGDLQDDVEMIDQAVRCCAKVAELIDDPSQRFWNDWGVALMKWAELTQDQASIEAAIEKFEKALMWDENETDLSIYEPDWLYNYACAFDFLGDNTETPRFHEKAIQLLTFLVQQDSTLVNARYNLALALSNLGEAVGDVDSYLKASEHYQVVLEENNEDEYAWNDWGICLLNLAQLIEDPIDSGVSQKYYEQSEEKFLRAIALGSTEAFYSLACLYALVKNYGAAMHYIERAEAAGTLPPIDDVLHDDWLEGLRETNEFRHFVALLSQRNEQER